MQVGGKEQFIGAVVYDHPIHGIGRGIVGDIDAQGFAIQRDDILAGSAALGAYFDLIGLVVNGYS